MNADVKLKLAAYFRQQIQISMPDLISETVSGYEFGVENRKLSINAGAVNKTVPPAGSTKNHKLLPESTIAATSPAARSKLAGLRTIDQLSIEPRSKTVKISGVENQSVTFEQKREVMKSLFFKGCTSCHLSNSRTKMVFGAGNVDAQVMVIGEAPGHEEDIQGLPFVGPAGQLLTQMLEAIQLNRENDLFITNILKCRPPSNRNPDTNEVQACLPLLKRQIAIMQPKAILLLGRIAAHSLLGTADSIAKMRSKVFDYENIPCMVIYHPSALLRNAAYKRPAWEDLQKFKELLEKLGVHGSSI